MLNNTKLFYKHLEKITVEIIILTRYVTSRLRQRKRPFAAHK